MIREKCFGLQGDYSVVLRLSPAKMRLNSNHVDKQYEAAGMVHVINDK